MNSITFAETLKRVRKMRGFTQKDLADELGLSTRCVQKWEHTTDPTLPTKTNIRRLSEVLDVPIGILYCEDRFTVEQWIGHDTHAIPESEAIGCRPLDLEEVVKCLVEAEVKKQLAEFFKRGIGP